MLCFILICSWFCLLIFMYILVTSFKKSTFKGLIRKKGHIDKKLGGGGGRRPHCPHPLLWKACITRKKKKKRICNMSKDSILWITLMYKWKRFELKDWSKILISEAPPELFLEISQNSQQNTCARESFLITLQTGLQLYWKRVSNHRYFPVNFVEFIRTSFLHNTSGRLIIDW